jgi:Tfp pilus assembly protein PilF
LQSTVQRGTQKQRVGKRAVEKEEIAGTPRWRTLGLSLILVLITVSAYNSVIHNAFVNFDDGDYILHTPQIRQGFSWNFFRWAFTTFAQANWHPLTWVSYAIDYRLFSSKPADVHLESVFIHALTAVVLFLLLQDVTASRWKSLAVSALYALHPLNVESVAWASERKTVLCMLFFMLGWWAWSRYTRQRTIGRYLAVVVAFALGLMAKPQIVTFPFVLLLWDIWPLGRLDGSSRFKWSSFSPLIVEKVPLFILSAASSIVTYRAQVAGGAMSNLVVSSFPIRLENAVVAYARYLGKALWPAKLAVLYPYPVDGLPAWQIVAATALLLVISAIVLMAHDRGYLAIGWFWFLGTLVPVIGLVQVGHASMADRYACLPLVGLFLMMVWGISDFAKARTIPGSWMGVAAAVVVVLMAVTTRRQVSYWHDSETLWRHALATTKDNFVAQDNLGVVLLSKGAAEEAIQHFHAAFEMQPHDPLANLYMGIYEGELGNHQAAVDHLITTVNYLGDGNPEVTEQAYDQLGTEYRNLHNFPESRQSFKAALRINPADTTAEIGMGLVAERDKNYSEAVQWYSEAMLKEPSPVVSLLLANVFRENGQPQQSVQAFQKAQSLSNDFQGSVSIADQMLISIE